jgi:hypothetical protein
MTREEREKAIDLLDNLRGMIEDNQGNDYDFALKKGIEALEQEPCEDAISRRAAVEFLENHAETYEDVGVRMGFKAAASLINNRNYLPSVTPQQKYEDIAKAFQFGLAFGFGEKNDEMDRIIDEIKKVVTPQPTIYAVQIDVLDKIRAEILDILYVDSLIFGELIDFKNGKISADDVIEEFNRVTRMEILHILDKYKAEAEDKK